MRFGATIEATKVHFKFMTSCSFRFFKGRKKGSVARLLRRIWGLLFGAATGAGKCAATAGLAYALVSASSVSVNLLHAQQEFSHAPRVEFSPYTYGLRRTAEEKAILFLQVLNVPDTQIATMLGISDDKVARRSNRALQEMRQKLTTALGAPAGAELADLDINQEIMASFMASEIWDGLSPVKTTGGIDLTTLMKDSSKGVKVFGLSTNAKEVSPLAAIVPAGVLQVGTPLSLTVPVVLSPDKDGVQRMVVSEARHLFTRADGGSVYILKSYCLDENADAPTLTNTRFRFSEQEQAILDDRLRDIIKNSSEDVLQNAIWDLRNKAVN